MPFGLFGYGVLILAILGSLSYIGYRIRESGYDACKVEWSEAAAAQSKREHELSAFAAKALADERAKKKVVIQTRTAYVDREVEKPVYRNQCFADTGVSCLNAAIAGKDAAGCKPGGTLPATKPAN